MNDKKLMAGAGTGVIRFPMEMFPLEGFCGIHDDPHVRVLIIECGERIALAAFEMVNIQDEMLELSKKLVSEKTGTKLQNVWIHMTHAITTPHAPKKPEDSSKLIMFSSAVSEAVTEAAESAVASFREAALGINTGICDVNINRDVCTPFGWWIGFDPEGYSNKTATVLRFNDSDGSPIAVLINYGVKPCAIDNSEMEKGSRLVSSDVPGLACMLLEEKFGAPCIFTMSAAGDQVPKEQAWYDKVTNDGTVKKVDRGVSFGLELVAKYGRQMADETAPIIEAAVCANEAPEIKRAFTEIVWPTKGRGKMKPTRSPEYVAEGEYAIGADIITIGDTAIVAVKPEVNAITERGLKNNSCFENTLLISMVNGGFKYMPDMSAYDDVTWEAQSAGLMPGAAEAWTKTTCDALKKLREI